MQKFKWILYMFVKWLNPNWQFLRYIMEIIKCCCSWWLPFYFLLNCSFKEIKLKTNNVEEIQFFCSIPYCVSRWILYVCHERRKWRKRRKKMIKCRQRKLTHRVKMLFKRFFFSFFYNNFPSLFLFHYMGFRASTHNITSFFFWLLLGFWDTEYIVLTEEVANLWVFFIILILRNSFLLVKSLYK